MSDIDNLLIKAGELLGEVPKTEEDAIFELQQRLIDNGNDWVSDLDDLSSLIDTTSILEGKSIFTAPDPSFRTGLLIDVDQYQFLPEIIALGKKCKESGWILQERKLWYSLIRGGKVCLKIAGLRNTVSGKLSLRIVIRESTFEDLVEHLDLLGLNEYRIKEWHARAGGVTNHKEILGRYFFFEDVYKFIDNITERIKNNAKTEKMAGLQLISSPKPSSRKAKGK